MTIVMLLTMIVLGWHEANAAARLAVEAVATIMGMAIFAHAARVRRRIMAIRYHCGCDNFGQRSSRSERRLIATGLKLAIRQTEFRNLFPQVAVRCERLLGIAAPR